MYSGGYMGMAECSLESSRNFKTFLDLPLWLHPPGSDGISRPFLASPPHDGMLFQDLSWLSQSAPFPPPTPTHTATITEATWHKTVHALFLTTRNSRNSLSDCYTFQYFGFNKKSTWWKLQSPAGDILIGKLEIYIFKFLETYSLIFNTSNNMCYIPRLQN